jgi:hypothetical protein
MRQRESRCSAARAAAWPLAASAQQDERMRRTGVLMPLAADDADFRSWIGAFLQGLAQLGWIVGRNIRIETRWTKFDALQRELGLEVSDPARPCRRCVHFLALSHMISFESCILFRYVRHNGQDGGGQKGSIHARI